MQSEWAYYYHRIFRWVHHLDALSLFPLSFLCNFLSNQVLFLPEYKHTSCLKTHKTQVKPPPPSRYQQSVFYRLDALLVDQPTVSKHTSYRCWKNLRNHRMSAFGMWTYDSIHVQLALFIRMISQSINVAKCSFLTSGLVMNFANMYAAESSDLSRASRWAYRKHWNNQQCYSTGL